MIYVSQAFFLLVYTALIFWNADLFLLCTVKTNDMMLVIYLSSLIRSVIALHNLINNKVRKFLQIPAKIAYFSTIRSVINMLAMAKNHAFSRFKHSPDFF